MTRERPLRPALQDVARRWLPASLLVLAAAILVMVPLVALLDTALEQGAASLLAALAGSSAA